MWRGAVGRCLCQQPFTSKGFRAGGLGGWVTQVAGAGLMGLEGREAGEESGTDVEEVISMHIVRSTVVHFI